MLNTRNQINTSFILRSTYLNLITTRDHTTTLNNKKRLRHNITLYYKKNLSFFSGCRHGDDAGKKINVCLTSW